MAPKAFVNVWTTDLAFFPISGFLESTGSGEFLPVKNAVCLVSIDSRMAARSKAGYEKTEL